MQTLLHAKGSHKGSYRTGLYDSVRLAVRVRVAVTGVSKAYYKGLRRGSRKLQGIL